ncbi:hypothetical protein PV08_02555 [Exophiala spinifera]|uniref:NAD-dependent epimerase/dehydratase domain-containing protein n=1 Tax=Exophiala spinifera TaxID=91928 RepID=A0A0D1ZZV6_9EURO|nr:uncharacterized protein PV08_02555 [Exophiala spinifera]KIW18267.1 hypothetical protein PV08_02555 [Exophiala spinifera]
MRVFITGASGFIGSAATRELLSHGHQVLGLARSDASADAVTEAGAEVLRGDLEDLEALKSGAKASDAVLHLGFIHDFSNMARNTAVDRAAISAMADAIAGSGKALMIASGSLMVRAKGGIATEDTEITREAGPYDRWKSEDLLLSLAKEKNIRGMIARFAPTVHGAGDKGFAKIFVDMARKNGRAIYTDASARWPACHRLDAAVLLRLALEKGQSGGTYHAVAEQGVLLKDTQELIGKRLNLPATCVSVEEGAQSLGYFAYAMAMDNPTSSEKTQKELGWEPKQIGLHEDMLANYFG